MDVTASGRRRSLNGWVASARWPEVARGLVGVAGLALLVVGAVKFAGASGDGGTIALVIVGAILLVSPFVLTRLQRVSVSMTQVDLWLTTQVSDRGAPEAAAILQRTSLGSFAESYAFVHGELGGEFLGARQHLQDVLIRQAATVAEQEKFDAREVRRLFANGSLVVRVLAIGLMQGDTSLADVDTILSAINEGRSRNEQFQAMVLAQEFWPKLSPAEQSDIRWAVGRAKFEPGSARHRKAQELLGPGIPDPELPEA